MEGFTLVQVRNKLVRTSENRAFPIEYGIEKAGADHAVSEHVYRRWGGNRSQSEATQTERIENHADRAKTHGGAGPHRRNVAEGGKRNAQAVIHECKKQVLSNSR